MLRRRGFTISSLSFWVFILFLAVAAGHLVWAMNDPRWQAKAIVPYLFMFVAIPLVMAAVMGFAAWIIFRKSDLAGNFVFCGLLLMMIGMRVAIMAGLTPKGFTFRGSVSGAASSPAPPVLPSSPSTFQRPTTQARPTSPQAPPVSAPSDRPAIQQPTPTASPPEPTALTVDPKVQATLDAIKSEVAAEVAAMWPDVAAAFTEWAKPPKHDMRDLDARKANATDLKALAERLAKRLQDLPREAQQRMVDAGVDSATARGESGRFMATYRSSWRATACDSIGRAADRIIEESEFLKQGFSKWSIDAKGEITSKDFAFKGRANGLRSSAEFSVRDKDALRKRLDEGG